MGTRADFYLGRGNNAKWLCSTAWDGYPSGISEGLLAALTQDEFIAELAAHCEGRDDVTAPEQGWPWPWATSHTTDFAYAFDDGKVWASCFGKEWRRAANYDEMSDEERDGLKKMPADAFPDMSDVKNVTLGRRSGVLLIGPK